MDRHHFLLYAIFFFYMIGCSEDSTTQTTDIEVLDQGEAVLNCPLDQNNNLSEAESIDYESDISGYLCPFSDEDWYRFTMVRDSILQVSVAMETALSPIDLMYDVYQTNGTDTTIVAQPVAQEAATTLQIQHCVSKGDLALRIYDLNQDAQDKRHTYTVSLQTFVDPDMNEALDQQAPQGDIVAIDASEPAIEFEARPLTVDMAQEGWIACRGDEDWYKVEVADRSILSWMLTVTQGEGDIIFVPKLVLYDDHLNPILTQEARTAERAEGLEREISISEGGTFYFKVSDVSILSADLNTKYQLAVDIKPDLDINEPNNQAGDASILEREQLTCIGEAWSPEATQKGYLGTLGDLDWFQVNTEGCVRGLLEVSLQMDAIDENNREESYEQFEPAVALLRAHPESPCAYGEEGADQECRTLNEKCGDRLDCAGIASACLPNGEQNVCAGSVSCLPNSYCAALVLERKFVPADEEASSEQELEVHFTVPLNNIPSTFYLRIADFAGNAVDTNRPYRLIVRVRNDPDLNEPNNTYASEIVQSDYGKLLSMSFGQATKIRIHNATEYYVDQISSEEKATQMNKEAGEMAGTEAGMQAGTMAGMQAGTMAGMQAGTMAGTEAGTMAGTMAGMQAGEMAGTEAGMQAGTMAGMQAGTMAGMQAGTMAGTMAGMQAGEMAGTEAGMQAGTMAGMQAGTMAGMQAGTMAGTEAGMQAGTEAGMMSGTEAGTEVEIINGQIATCCDCPGAQWTKGYISYEHDIDLYEYEHPCPGEDCMIKIHYKIGKGPVDMLWQIYESQNLWFSPIVTDIEERREQMPREGIFGGLNSQNQCFYAFQQHEGNYQLSIRDLQPSFDWSISQHYEFCIEKIANGCYSPCVDLSTEENPDRGCSVP